MSPWAVVTLLVNSADRKLERLRRPTDYLGEGFFCVCEIKQDKTLQHLKNLSS